MDSGLDRLVLSSESWSDLSSERESTWTGGAKVTMSAEELRRRTPQGSVTRIKCLGKTTTEKEEVEEVEDEVSIGMQCKCGEKDEKVQSLVRT